MKAHRHQSRATLERDTPFFHCVAGDDCDARAHGGIVVLQTCRCGAHKAVAVNQNRIERGPWTKDEE